MFNPPDVRNCLGALAVVVTLNALQDRIALGCSRSSCERGEMFPTGGQVPANAVVVFQREVLWLSWENADAGASRLDIRVVDSTGEERAIAFEEVPLSGEDAGGDQAANRQWVPAQRLAAGDRLQLEYTDACSGATERGEVTIVAEAISPETLGEVVVAYATDELEVFAGSAACTASVLTRYANVSVELSKRAQPWADILRYELLVDGERFESDDWPEQQEDWTWGAGRGIGGSRLGRGVERVFAICEPTDGEVEGGVSAGKHQVQMRAFCQMAASLKPARTTSSSVVPQDLPRMQTTTRVVM